MALLTFFPEIVICFHVLGFYHLYLLLAVAVHSCIVLELFGSIVLQSLCMLVISILVCYVLGICS